MFSLISFLKNLHEALVTGRVTANGNNLYKQSKAALKGAITT